jgi:hypothetical protein
MLLREEKTSRERENASLAKGREAVMARTATVAVQIM